MSRPVRIGVIGAGGNTRTRHIPSFKAIPGVEVVAVCNRTKASGEKVAREFGIPRVTDNWKEIVEAPDIDAICIGTWPNLHGKLTVAALRWQARADRGADGPQPGRGRTDAGRVQVAPATRDTDRAGADVAAL